MNLKEILGTAYKEGMTFAEIETALKDAKLADLSKGKYVDVDKYNNTVNDLRNQLNGKLSEAEKQQNAEIEKDKRIADLEKLLKENTLESNKRVMESLFSETKTILGLKDDDTSLAQFIQNVNCEDSTKVNNVGTYVAKLVKDAYEKGQKDGMKGALGGFGKQKGNASSGYGEKEIENLGKRLAEKNKNTTTLTTKYDYFNQNK